MADKAIKSALAKIRPKPSHVTAWKVESGPDATGEFAVWVWVILDDPSVKESVRDRLRLLVRKTVYSSKGHPPQHVYVRFRSESETEDK